MLAAWRWFWPVLVLPVGRPPGPGHVAGLVLPAPLGRGDDHLPGWRPGTRAGPCCRCWARSPPPGTPTGYMSGWSPGSPRPTSPITLRTWRTGSGRCCAGSAPPSPGAVVLEFIRRDALAALVLAVSIPDTPDLKALPVGRREDGLPWLVRLHGTHVLIAGATGAGKASLLWGLVRAMFPLMQQRPGPHPGRRPQADGAGLRPGHLRHLRRLRRRPGRHRRDARARQSPTCRTGRPGSPDASVTIPPRSRTRSPWCWWMRWRS